MLPRLFGVLVAFGALLTPVSAVYADSATWSDPVTIDSTAGSPTALSCASSTSCTLVDRSGRVVHYDGTRWSAPKQVDGEFSTVSCFHEFCVAGGDGLWESRSGGRWHRAFEGSSMIRSASCGSVSTCVAVDEVGRVMERTSSGWSDPVRVAPGFRAAAVSCRGNDFCALVLGRPGESGGYAATYDGSTWTTPVRVDGRPLQAVSCWRAGACLAGNSNASFVELHAHVWTNPRHAPTGILSVSCRAASFCMAVDDYGYASRWDGKDWRVTALDHDGGGLGSVSCGSTSFCLAVDGGGYDRVFVHSAWAKTRSYVDPTTGRISSISCPSAAFCMAVDEYGNAIRFDGAHWSMPERVNPTDTGLSDVSCASADFCVAEDRGTASWSYNGSDWTRIRSADGYSARYDLSCPTAGFCMSSGYYAGPRVFRRGTWSNANGDNRYLPTTGLACAARKFCVAGGKDGHLLSWNGSRWHLRRPRFDKGAFGIRMSCASTAFCLAVDGSGRWKAFRDGTWEPTRAADPERHFSGLSCASSTFCLASDNGSSVIFDGSGWTGDAAQPALPFYDVTCASADFCAATDGNYDVTLRTDGAPE